MSQTPTKPVSRWFWYNNWVPLIAVVAMAAIALPFLFAYRQVRVSDRKMKTTPVTAVGATGCAKTIISRPGDSLHSLAAHAAYPLRTAPDRVFRRLRSLNPDLPEQPAIGTVVRVPNRLDC